MDILLFDIYYEVSGRAINSPTNLVEFDNLGLNFVFVYIFCINNQTRTP